MEKKDERKEAIRRLEAIESHLSPFPSAANQSPSWFPAGQTKKEQKYNPKIHPSLHSGFSRWFDSVRKEESYTIGEIEGTIPQDLEGTYYREGPGIFEVGNVRQHLIDADGMIVSVAFRNGSAFFRNKHVRTKAFIEERCSGPTEKHLYRGAYGTKLEGTFLLDTWWKNTFNFNTKNPANTNFLPWGGKLLVLYEMGLPHLVDPVTLDTIGEWDINGVLKKDLDVFSAHPRFDARRKRVVNFGINYRTRTLSIWEFDENWDLIQKHSIPLPTDTVVHSFAITDKYIVIPMSPVVVKGLEMLIFASPVDDCIGQNHSKETIYLVFKRETGLPKGTVNTHFEIYHGEILHHNHTLNAWEEPSGEITLFATPFDDRPRFDIIDSAFTNPPSYVRKFSIPIGRPSEKVKGIIFRNKSAEVPSCRPGLDGVPHKYAYFVDLQYIPQDDPAKTIQPWSAVIKLDLQTGEEKMYRPSRPRYMSEACFVPRAGSDQEDDGYILHLEFNPETGRSCIVIHDAKAFEPIAKVHLKVHIPFTFHGVWLDHYTGPR